MQWKRKSTHSRTHPNTNTHTLTPPHKHTTKLLLGKDIKTVKMRTVPPSTVRDGAGPLNKWTRRHRLPGALQEGPTFWEPGRLRTRRLSDPWIMKQWGRPGRGLPFGGWRSPCCNFAVSTSLLLVEVVGVRWVCALLGFGASGRFWVVLGLCW